MAFDLSTVTRKQLRRLEEGHQAAFGDAFYERITHLSANPGDALAREERWIVRNEKQLRKLVDRQQKRVEETQAEIRKLESKIAVLQIEADVEGVAMDGTGCGIVDGQHRAA